ncbi:MAG: hypothetical protein LBB93_01505, partial [Elusimicrobiota bacterium]|jgi:hypothetical protein|nr:hypothetical protein [Elusimicrobiota bacterium]
LETTAYVCDTLYFYRKERDGQLTGMFTNNISEDEKDKQIEKYWCSRNQLLEKVMLLLKNGEDKNKYIDVFLLLFSLKTFNFRIPYAHDCILGIAKGTGKPTQKQKDFFYDLSVEFKRFDHRKELIEKLKPYRFPIFEYLENKDIKSFYKFFRDDERRISACKRFEELIFGKTLEREYARDLLSAKMVFSILKKYVPSISTSIDINSQSGAWLKKWTDEKFKGAAEYLALSSCDLPQEKLLIDKSKVKQVEAGKIKFSDINRRYDLAIRVSDDKKISTNIDDEIDLLADLSDLIIFAGDDTSQNPANSYLFRKKGYECFDIFRDEIWNHPFFYLQTKQNIALFAKGQRAKELIDKGLKPVDFLSSKYCETFVAESKKTALKEVEKLKKFYKKVLLGTGAVLLLVVSTLLLF